MNISIFQACIFCHRGGWYRLPICQTCLDKMPWHHYSCPRCANPMPTNTLCGQCITQPPYFDHTFCCFSYKAPINRMLMQLKYHQQIQQAVWLAQCFSQHPFLTIDQQPSALICTPLHKQRIKQRGYNQAQLIAQHLSKRLQIPLLKNHLIRSKNTKPQTSLTAKKRQGNLYRAFNMIKKIDVDHVAIVDDVMTTGSTLNALAYCLKQQGIKRIDCYVIARATLQH